jgi:hypothetical protein
MAKAKDVTPKANLDTMRPDRLGIFYDQITSTTDRHDADIQRLHPFAGFFQDSL